MLANCFWALILGAIVWGAVKTMFPEQAAAIAAWWKENCKIRYE